ncbi:MAG: KamA family radical SAM protein [bacterium]
MATTWKLLLNESITDPDDIARAFGLDLESTKRVCKVYPVKINPYFLKLAQDNGKALSRQVVPDIEELSPRNTSCPQDPIMEEANSPVANLTHRYHDRVLFLISDTCPVHCRFCTRKRKVGKGLTVTNDTIREGIEYIRGKPEIRDVLLSGGDPLLLEDDKLEGILDSIRQITHVEVIRVGTRVPGTLPQRVDEKLARMLSRFHPLYIHTHFNHPAEIAPESSKACRILADAGIPLSSQTVLLAGINDDTDTLEALFRSLLSMRVRPYYLFQSDMVRGSEHFRTPIERGIQLIDALRSCTSEMALPKFAVDLPEGKGKVVLDSGHLENGGKGEVMITTLEGEKVKYPNPAPSG